jgi:hypothetical protein
MAVVFWQRMAGALWWRGLGEGSGALEGIGAGGLWGSMGGRGWRAGAMGAGALRGKGRIPLLFKRSADC